MALAAIYLLSLLIWLGLTLYWLIKVIRGRKHTSQGLEYTFPLWRKQGSFSGSAFWCWIAIPSSLLLMFIIPIFPGQVALAMANNGFFWTAIIGLVSSVLINYYQGKSLSVTGGSSSLIGTIKNKITGGGEELPPPPAPGEPP